ncbi:CpaF family protein [Frankia sp. AgB1.9]|uniref:CpaF family protein n=1 Tax=unclassified Frankia TaxID=2632575 RepID=UPI0019316C31|nr:MULTISPECIES: ATPase, T2SS/T4P/T4SS family [unclassified Frankia]MBL7491996.1 CpaF family protein [Frankia sp. AgW1.1]MBL7548365.1 CpaF family protein [Frankia sp. AgB1.9]MBL7619073.1 CpaF family protein [Frankia sp. AgB1.8]
MENEVRELVRRRALDPAREPVVVRRLVDDVLGDYEERVLTSDLPPIVDRELVARLVYDAVAGFGPLQRHLDDPAVEEIWINEPGRVFIARHGRSELTTTILTGDQVQDLVERMLKTSGRRVDLSTPFVDAMLPDGSRLHVVIPDVTRLHWSVNIRKFILSASSLDELVAKGTLPPAAAAFLEASVIAGLNIIIAGGTQAGKTTMLNCLGSAIPARERVISCEEVFELRLRSPDWVAMQTRQANLEGTGEIRLRRLIKEALRMRPDRLLVGEVRQEEALDLLIALNSGLPGMCSLHANSAREAVTKLCTLPLLAGENVSHNFVVPTVAASVDLVVHLIKDAHGRRRVTEIVALPGRAEGDVVEVAQIFRSYGDTLVRAEGYPPHPDRFARAGYDLAALLAPADRGWPEIAVER